MTNEEFKYSPLVSLTLLCTQILLVKWTCTCHECFCAMLSRPVSYYC